MKKVKLLWKSLLCACLLCVGFSSCSDENSDVLETGEGGISLNLSAENVFYEKTKAVNVTDYEDVQKYTVQILKEDKVVSTYLYSAIPEFIPLSNGKYELKAFYGEDKPASTTSMYMEGKTSFNVNNDRLGQTVTCKPVCGRIKVVFDPTMATYFNDYSIVLGTKALGETSYTWKKDMVDPVYLRVEDKEAVSAHINLTDKNGKVAVVPDKTYQLSPQISLTINVKPVVKNGNVGIQITIDKTTNDHEVEIEIPSDWK